MKYDLIVIGAGPSGLIAGIQAAKNGLKVCILEKLPRPAAKLRATGGGRCNLTNTLSNVDLMAKFGRQGRFMNDALQLFDHQNLIQFFNELNVPTHAPDGFRVFPITHNSSSIVDALLSKFKALEGDLKTNQPTSEIIIQNSVIIGVKTKNDLLHTNKIIIATGGLGYPALGATGDGFEMAKKTGHKVTTMHPAMMPLSTQETWVKNCTADTIPKVTIRVNIKGDKLQACGDLIFTKTGLRGPVILDFSREITPLLSKGKNVPLLINFIKGKNEEEISKYLKKQHLSNPQNNILQHVSNLLPKNLSVELCKMAKCCPTQTYNKIDGKIRVKLCKLLAWTPLTITGHDGFKMAMITRGGIKLSEVDPKTMQSKIQPGLYFCGEILDLDGPCGGYNLTWAFSSGFLAGNSV